MTLPAMVPGAPTADKKNGVVDRVRGDVRPLPAKVTGRVKAPGREECEELSRLAGGYVLLYETAGNLPAVSDKLSRLAGGYVLLYRPHSRAPWKRVATTDTYREAMALVTGPGDWWATTPEKASAGAKG